MLPISTQDVLRFTPLDAQNQDKPPVYMIGVPKQLERAAWRRDVRAQGATYPSELDRLTLMKKGVEEMARPEQKPELLAVIAEAIAAREEQPRAVIEDPPKLQRIGEILHQNYPPYAELLGEILHQNYPPYAELLGERDYWLSVAPIMAARRFLQGWENVDLPFERQFGLVPEALIEFIAEAHVAAIGWQAITRMTLSKEREKNSVSPPPSLPSPTSTTAASAPPTDQPGNSSASATSATPAS